MAANYNLRSAKDFLNAFEELYQQSPIPQIITSTLGYQQQSPAPLAGQHGNIKAIFDQMKMRRSTSMSMSSDLNTTSTTVTDASSGETASRGAVLQNELGARKRSKEEKSATTEANAGGAGSASNTEDLGSCAADQSLMTIPQSPALQAHRSFAKRAAQIDGKNQPETAVTVAEKNSIRISPRKSFAQRITDCHSSEGDASLLKTKRCHDRHALNNSEMNLLDGCTLADVPCTGVEKVGTQKHRTVLYGHGKDACNSDSNSWGARMRDETGSPPCREDDCESFELPSISNTSVSESLPLQSPEVCYEKTVKAQKNKRQTGKTVKLVSRNSAEERITERDKHWHTLYEHSSQKEMQPQSSVESHGSPDLLLTSLVAKTTSVVADKQGSNRKADEETLHLASKLAQRLHSASDSDLEDFFAEDHGQMKISLKASSSSPIASVCEMRKASHPSTQKACNTKERDKYCRTKASYPSRKCNQNHSEKARESSQRPETRGMSKQAMTINADTRVRKNVQSASKADSRRGQQVEKTHRSLRPRQRPVSHETACDSTQASSTQMLAVNSQKDVFRLDALSPEQLVSMENDAIFAFNSKDRQRKRTAELFVVETKKNNPKSAHLENDKNGQSDVLMLHSWSLQPAPKQNGVRVEGKFPNAQYFWCTSVISERITSLRLQSASGTVYCLVGPLSRSSTVNAGFSKQLAAAFSRGFPQNWRELILADLEAMNITEAKTNSRTKRTKKSLDGRTECDDAGQQMCAPQSTNKPLTKISTPIQPQKKDHSEGAAIWTPVGIMSREMDASQVKRTRSGRCVIPPLARWAGQYSERDANGNVTIGFSSLAAENHFARMVEVCANVGRTIERCRSLASLIQRKHVTKEGQTVPNGETTIDRTKGYEAGKTSSSNLPPRHKAKPKSTAGKRKGANRAARTTEGKQAAQQCSEGARQQFQISESDGDVDTAQNAVPVACDNIEKKGNNQGKDSRKTTTDKAPHKENSKGFNGRAILVDLHSAEESEPDVDNMGSDLLRLVKKSAEMRKKKLKEKRTTCYSQADMYSRSRTSSFDITDDDELEEASTVGKVRKSKGSNPGLQSCLTDKSDPDSEGQSGSVGLSSDSGERKGTADIFGVLKAVLKPSAPRGSKPQCQASTEDSIPLDRANEYVLRKDEVIFHQVFSYHGEEDDYNKIPNNNRLQNNKIAQPTPQTDLGGSLKQRSRTKRNQAKKHDIKSIQTSGIQTKPRLRGLLSCSIETAPDDSDSSDSEQFGVDSVSPHRDIAVNSSKVSLPIERTTMRKRKLRSEALGQEEKSSQAKKSKTTSVSLVDKTDEKAVTKSSQAEKSRTAGTSLEVETDEEIMTKTSRTEKIKTARVSLQDFLKTSRIPLEDETDEKIVTKSSQAKNKTAAANRPAAEVRCWDVGKHPQQILVQNVPGNVSSQKQSVRSEESAKSDEAVSRTLRKRLVGEVKKNSAVDSSKRQTRCQRLCAQKSVVIESENNSGEETGEKGSQRPQDCDNVKQLVGNSVETSQNNSAFACSRTSEETREIKMDHYSRIGNRVTDGQQRTKASKQGQSNNVDSREDSLRWTKQEIQRLNEAMKQIGTDTNHYWEVVSHHVGSRTAEECAAQCLQDMPHTKRASDKSLKTNSVQKGISAPVLQATKGTLKRKQELRAILEHDGLNTNDDLFQSTPFRHMCNRKVPIVDFTKTDEEVFGKNPTFFTPCADGLRKSKGGFSKTPASTRKTPSISGAFSPLIEKGSIRRKAADQYVFRMQKNRRRLARVYPNQEKDLSTQPDLSEQSPAKRLFAQPGASELFTITETNVSDEDEEQDYYYSDAD